MDRPPGHLTPPPCRRPARVDAAAPLDGHQIVNRLALVPTEQASNQQRGHEPELEPDAAWLAQRVEALERALSSRPRIEQAKGVLMAVFGISADAAFDALVWTSQHTNVKLAVIAERFLDQLADHDLGNDTKEQVTHALARTGTPSPDSG